MSAQRALSSQLYRSPAATAFIKMNNRQQSAVRTTNQTGDEFMPIDCEAIYDLAINLATQYYSVARPGEPYLNDVVNNISIIKTWDLENINSHTEEYTSLDQHWNGIQSTLDKIDASQKVLNQQALSSHPIALGGNVRRGGADTLTRGALRLTLAFILQALMLVGLMLIISTLNYGYSEWLCKDVRAPHTIFEALSRAFKPAPSPFMRQLCSLAASKSNPALDAAVIMSDHACIFIVYSIVSVLLSKAANMKMATSFVKFLPQDVARVASVTTAFMLTSASASQYMADMLVGKPPRTVCKQPQTSEQDPRPTTPVASFEPGQTPLDILAEVCSDLWANRQIRAAEDILRGEDVPPTYAAKDAEPVERTKATKSKSTSRTSKQPIHHEENVNGGAPKRKRIPKGKATKGKTSAPSKYDKRKSTGKPSQAKER